MSYPVIHPEDIKPGDEIEDAFGHRGVVVENMHPWGFRRLQYDGLTIILHPDPEHYRLVSKRQA